MLFFDIECYSNYFLVCFKLKKGTKFYELHENSELNRKEIKILLSSHCSVGFNSNDYDLPMITHAINLKSTNESLKRLSDILILSKDKRDVWEAYNDFEIDYSTMKEFNHIDLFNVAPKLDTEKKVGLKVYGARLHTRILQDLPIEPSSIIRQDQHKLLRKYCENDVNITIELYEEIKDLIDFREEISKKYGIDLRSSSDAQIAEKIIRHHFKITKVANEPLKEVFKYTPPSYLKFKNPIILNWLNDVINCDFRCDENGKIIKNKEIDKKFTISNKQYSVAIGGMHTINKAESYVATEDEYILDVDFASYYPAIMLVNKYYPKKLGEQFLNFYGEIKKQRLIEKKAGNKKQSETYKIILNGSFGKTASIWSCLYSPETFIHITLTGQLTVLLLVEKLNDIGCEIISANTDGITFKGKRANLEHDKKIIEDWASSIELEIETVLYKAIYHENVNSYVAIKEDKSLKCKGTYADRGLRKNPVNIICVDAVLNYLQKKKPIRWTILESKHDITKFISVRKVKTGAYYGDEYLGKTVRWYYGVGGKPILNKKGDKVASTDLSVPIMDLNNYSVPLDINMYIEKTHEMFKNLGVKI